jgi:hypothetical protein
MNCFLSKSRASGEGEMGSERGRERRFEAVVATEKQIGKRNEGTEEQTKKS